MRTGSTLALAIGAGSAVGVSGALARDGVATGDVPAGGGQVVYWDTWDAQGNLSGGKTVLPVDVPVDVAAKAANVVGPADELLDVVFVGDGYTAAEIAEYRADAANAQSLIFAYEPFITYLPFIRFHTIDVVSNESGVDNDPVQGIDRDTALDMSYWCSGIERLLCVSVSKAYGFANQAPDVDQVVALANSSKYGGAGYPGSDLGTAAAKNSFAGDIVIHELGHALGDLADEYTYGGPTTYTGGERPEANASIYNASQMASLNTKWAGWLGAGLPGFDSPIGAFEGAHYSVFGVYRPSNNSMMRALGRPFNLVSAEKLIIEMHEATAMIRSVSPSGDAGSADTLSVDVVERTDGPMRVRWLVNGSQAAIGNGLYERTPAQVGAGPGDTVTAEVIDDTPWVIDESARASVMTERYSWGITGGGCNPADLASPFGELTFGDISAFLAAFNTADPAADLASPFGQFTFGDISAFLAAFDAGCP
jgi:hypothetical protein